ncbi:MAG: hypothetical protein ACD_67C00066G0001 [uncultured bacterium]|nr:MAG: hypothetical protein ACD_67C00066G0001 [uncultured bacterium]
MPTPGISLPFSKSTKASSWEIPSLSKTGLSAFEVLFFSSTFNTSAESIFSNTAISCATSSLLAISLGTSAGIMTASILGTLLTNGTPPRSKILPLGALMVTDRTLFPFETS